MDKFDQKNEVQIFVSCHKEVDLFESEILQPVQVGAKNANERFPWACHDDEGDNISDLNPMYCELTAQYWAWKNVDCEKYGFCHYRRHFNFSNISYLENRYGEVLHGRINKKAQEMFDLTDEQILKQVEGYDIITTKFQDLRCFPGRFRTPREHWYYAPNLHNEDIELMEEVLLSISWTAPIGSTNRFNVFILKSQTKKFYQMPTLSLRSYINKQFQLCSRQITIMFLC